MSNFSKIFNDPNSPLAPITPLATNDKFTFNFGGDGSLDAVLHRDMPSPRRSPQVNRQQAVDVKPKRFSKNFKQLLDLFETGTSGSGRQRSPLQVLQRVNGATRRSIGSCEKPRSSGLCTNEVTIEYAVTPKTHKRSTKVSTPVRIVVSSPVDIPKPGCVCRSAGRKKKKQALTPGKCEDKPPSPLQKFLQQEALARKTCAKSRFRQTSPVAPKALDERVAWLLIKFGLAKYCGLFQQQEIDMPVLRMLTRDSLVELGIRKAFEQEKLLWAVEYAKKILLRRMVFVFTCKSAS